jgi:hypothetical protein
MIPKKAVVAQRRKVAKIFQSVSIVMSCAWPVSCFSHLRFCFLCVLGVFARVNCRIWVACR